MSPLFTIIHEDANLLVVSKPAGLVCHPTKGDQYSSLISRVRLHLGPAARPHLVNRLDRETSGLVLVAKNRTTARDLHTLIEKRNLTKRYLAIVRGWPAQNGFEVDQPLLRQGTIAPSKIWLKQAVHASGYPSRTRFRVRNRFENLHGQFALLECEPLTGRTHQIRVHLAFSGHPIVGDKIYGPNENCYLEFIETGWTPTLAQQLLLDRHALHAKSLAFAWGSEHFRFDSPLPEDLVAFCRLEQKTEK